MKDIKDYLHFYLGSQIQVTTDFAVFTGKFLGIYIDEWFEREEKVSIQVLINPTTKTMFTYTGEQVKLILRPLSDMTEEEMDEVWCLLEPKNVLVMTYESGKERKVVLCSERTKYFLSNGFDLFGLIKEGLAIDATKIKKP